MRARLALFLLLLSSVASAAKRDAAEEAYQEARTAYYVLKGDAVRRKLRHHWLNVARRFEAVATDHPKSPRAPDALFTAGELMNELSRISFLLEDLQSAAGDYSKVVENHPRHRLADDAALSLARIYLDRLDHPDAARRVITDSLANNSKGDRARELKELLASLPTPKTPPPPARKPAAPAVAEAAPAPAAQPDASKAGTSLVDAISKLARESGPTNAAPAPEAQDSKASSEAPRVVVITPMKTAEAPVPTAKDSKVAATPAAPASAPAPVAVTLPSKPKTEPVAVSVVKSAPEPTVVPVKPAPSNPVLDPHIAEARMKTAAKLSRRAELTLVEQLGLKVRRVIIDPGHGGHDTGAIGKNGTREKDITLAISLKLAEELKERGLEVILTREDDHYVRLEDRAQFANESRGDLFISIHCNSAASSKLHGVETYTLNISADRYSIRLAARENASTEKGISDLQFILADLATKANTGESTRLASQVQKSLVGQLSKEYSDIKDLGNKEALFYVLLGVKMPAILVETAFLSHSEEEQRLGSEAYQDSVAQAIAQGVEEFLGDRNKLAKVD
ncbi:N-acetylmuramoyl-L-alanine amidase [Hyalangium minutum]|uniref:N-acetylmuramoyl-L-alanine amidase n=1 Tax=Hyalangium minutum TaxID=394096 RepID=A0A085WQQ9_9BACT|nr:N-acetylmuramoyl-L-alanine amidase [Hyalangium minutum]KFE70022.1 N-acetylmuramoyl-L-alanine amidase [Hyalangium minutum]